MRFHLAVACCVLGCASRSDVSRPTQSASTLALSQDDALLYAVDADNDVVSVVATAGLEKLSDVKVGEGPSLLVVGPDDTVYVANRRGGSVSVIRRGEWSEAARWEAGAEPVGLAVSGDAQVLYVVSAIAAGTPTHGSLLALDAASGLPRWELPLGEEPRGIALVDDQHAVVTLLKQGLVQFIDLEARAVTVNADAYAQLNATALLDTGPVEAVHVRGLSAVTVTNEGSVLALGGLAPEGPQPRWGTCTPSTLIATTPAMIELDRNGVPSADDVQTCGEGWPTLLVSRFGGWPQQGAAAVAIDAHASWALVAMQQSNELIAFDHGSRPGIEHAMTVSIEGGPDGVALTADGRSSFVHTAFGHEVVRVTNMGEGLVADSRLHLVDDVLSPEVVAGRRRFYDASDTAMTSARRAVSCASCHLEGGRDDGHVWTFPEGKRQTVSLAGRQLPQTAPYHWDGAFPDLERLIDDTVRTRMGGLGLDAASTRQVAAYLAALPSPPNTRKPTARGEAAFAKAECGTCHSGPAFSNEAMLDVGTGGAMNVPSLLGLGRTAPYLHDGSAHSLLERVLGGRERDQHGRTSRLTDDEMIDLAEYLESL